MFSLEIKDYAEIEIRCVELRDPGSEYGNLLGYLRTPGSVIIFGNLNTPTLLHLSFNLRRSQEHSIYDTMARPTLQSLDLDYLQSLDLDMCPIFVLADTYAYHRYQDEDKGCTDGKPLSWWLSSCINLVRT